MEDKEYDIRIFKVVESLEKQDKILWIFTEENADMMFREEIITFPAVICEATAAEYIEDWGSDEGLW